MTVNDALVLAMSLLPDRPSDNPDLMDFAVGWVNLLLQEVLPCENSLRAARGEPELEAAPVVNTITDPIPVAEQIARGAIPYGLAYFVYIDDDNDYRSQDMRGRFIAALEECSRAVPTPVEDCY